MKHVIDKVTGIVIDTVSNVDTKYEASIHDFVDAEMGGAIGDHWDGVRFTEPGTPEGVKKEAARRIEEVAPLWKQMNFASEAVAILKKKSEIGSLAAGEQEKLEAHAQLKETIETIRAKSDALEAMTPIPGDFRDDTYWT